MNTSNNNSVKMDPMRETRFAIGVALALILGLVGPPAHAGGKCGDADECLQAMRDSIAKRGWLGIEYDTDEEKGLPEILKVLTNSPAEQGGLKRGDFLVSLNGVAYGGARKEIYAEVKKALIPGNEIVFQVERAEEVLEVKVTAGKVPDSVAAQWVGRHMIEYHDQAEETQGDSASDDS